MVGEPGELRLHDKVAAMMPTAAAPAELTLVSQGLVALQSTALYNYVGPSAQNVVKSVIDWLAAMVAGRRPSLSSQAQTNFFGEMQAGLGYFLSMEDPMDSSKLLIAGDALACKYTECAAMNGVDRTMNTVEDLTVYGWMLQQSAQDQVAAWAQEILDRMGSEAKAKQSAVQAARSKVTSKPGKSASSDSSAKEMELALAMFR